MNAARRINPDLLERAEAFARAKSLSIDDVIEHALSVYLGPKPGAPVSTGQPVDLPVATALQFISPQTCDMSYGKLLELADEGVTLNQAR